MIFKGQFHHVLHHSGVLCSYLCTKESLDIHTVVLVPSKHIGHAYFTDTGHISTMSKDFTLPWPLRPRPKNQNRKQSDGRQKSTCAIASLLMGVLFLLVALICAFFRTSIHDFTGMKQFFDLCQKKNF